MRCNLIKILLLEFTGCCKTWTREGLPTVQTKRKDGMRGWRDEGGVEGLMNSPKIHGGFFFNKQQTVKLFSNQSV